METAETAARSETENESKAVPRFSTRSGAAVALKYLRGNVDEHELSEGEGVKQRKRERETEK